MTNIYLITNTVNTIVYVGKTKHDIFQRFVEHLYNSYKTKDNASHITTKSLYVAMREIGQVNFKVELLESCEDDVSSIREAYYIDKYPENYNQQKPFPFTKNLLVELLKTKSTREIAKEYGIKDHSSICYLMKKYGLKKPDIYKSYSSLTKEKLYEEYIINKKTISQIAIENNVQSENTIRQRLKKYNIPRRTKEEYDIVKYPMLTKETLYEEYIINKKSSKQISDMFNIKDHHIILRLLKKYNIRRPN